jgi:hypothetical protein
MQDLVNKPIIIKGIVNSKLDLSKTIEINEIKAKLNET